MFFGHYEVIGPFTLLPPKFKGPVILVGSFLGGIVHLEDKDKDVCGFFSFFFVLPYVT